MAGGDSLVAHPRGCRPRSGRCRRKPGRRTRPVYAGRPAGVRGGPDRPRRTRHTGGVVTRPLPARFPTPPAPTSSSTPTAGSSTWARPSRSGSASTRTSRTRPGSAPRTAQMVSQADHVEWMVVDTEAEALLLEHNLIKQFQPRYNVRLKDDKSYPWLALTVNDEWPRPAVVRGPQAQRGPVLRPLPERRGHPGDPRPAAAVVPGADLLGHQVPAPPAAGPALPAVPHRTVLGTVRGGHRPRPSTTSWWPT